MPLQANSGGSDPTGQCVLPGTVSFASLEHPGFVVAGRCLHLVVSAWGQASSPAPYQCRAEGIGVVQLLLLVFPL